MDGFIKQLEMGLEEQEGANSTYFKVKELLRAQLQTNELAQLLFRMEQTSSYRDGVDCVKDWVKDHATTMTVALTWPFPIPTADEWLTHHEDLERAAKALENESAALSVITEFANRLANGNNPWSKDRTWIQVGGPLTRDAVTIASEELELHGWKTSIGANEGLYYLSIRFPTRK